jgi:hypothetical protein
MNAALGQFAEGTHLAGGADPKQQPRRCEAQAEER